MSNQTKIKTIYFLKLNLLTKIKMIYFLFLRMFNIGEYSLYENLVSPNYSPVMHFLYLL